MKPTRATMAFGTVVLLAALAAWLYGEKNGIDTNIVWVVVGPITVALFMGGKVDEAASAANQAAQQTNGVLDGRIKAAVAGALADRDAARTRQAQGDISEATPQPPSPPRAASDHP